MSTHKVLIVEDYASNAEMIAEAMVDAGFEVALLASATGFLKSVLEIKPDLIILDIKLPDGDGRNLCNEIYASDETAHIPVIIISAILESSFEDIPCPASAFITKPFDVDELVRRAVQMADRFN